MSRPDFQPRDPGFADRVRASFANQPLMTTLGAELREVVPGRVEIRLPRSGGILQQHGFVHGGAIAAIGDTACGYAAFSLMRSGQGVLTIEFKINLLSPGRQPLLVARGRVVRPGRTVTVAEAEIVGVEEDGREIPVALVLATLMAIDDRPDIVG